MHQRCHASEYTGQHALHDVFMHLQRKSSCLHAIAGVTTLDIASIV